MRGSMKIRLLIMAVILVLSSSLFLAARLDVFRGYGPLDKESYLTQEQILFIRPGLDAQILEVTLPADRKLVVKLSIKDPKGLPLDLDGVFTPGEISASFIIARIPAGQTQYMSYRTNSDGQPTSEGNGTWADLGDGIFTYTFANALPADFDPNVTHTLGIYMSRDLRDYGLDRYNANPIYTWVPSGAEVTVVREVVRTENCNQCHNPLRLHGRREEIGLCVLCHQPQNIDPDTGNTVDLKVMIHKIHRGANLPSVQAGTPYQIIGFRGSVHDYSEIHFPQDIRNCTTCHKDTAQADAWLLRPSRLACGSCHDDVNFATGENHPGGAQISDNLCSSCHPPEGELEFDASIMGAHTIPGKSRQLKGLDIQILEVQNGAAGQNPTVRFSIMEDDGTMVAPDSLSSFSLNMAGPTTDYGTLIRQSGARTGSTAVGDGSYSYTFPDPIPADSSGTWAVGAEGRRSVTLNAGTTDEMSTNESDTQNPVFFFNLDGGEPEPRRHVVSEAKCESCHENLEIHGGLRHDPDNYCVLCHNPNNTDIARRPEEELPEQSIHLKFMIHRIHKGHDLTREFTVYGFGGSKHTFSEEVHFPGDLRDCESCHVNDSYEIPLPEGLLPTQAPREFFSPLQPVAGACLGCHESEAAAAHAATMTAPFGEACAACHGSGMEFAVERVHAR